MANPSTRLEVWLERSDVRASRSVLRGGERGDSRTLPDNQDYFLQGKPYYHPVDALQSNY